MWYSNKQQLTSNSRLANNRHCVQYLCIPPHILLKGVERWPCCAVVLRKAAWSEHGMGMAWHGKCESDTAALRKSNWKDTF